MRPALLARLLLVAVLATAAVGCASAEVRIGSKILASVNAHAYYSVVYQRQCQAVVGPATCAEAQAALNAWKADAALATLSPDGTPRAGARPLLLGLLAADEARAKELLK